MDTDLLRELVDRLAEPSVKDARELPDLLARFVVPPDFQRLLTDDATVLLELDRDTASDRLKSLGVEVSLFLGAANSVRQAGFEPARRLDVLRVLLCGGNHIVHYRGHSDFDPTGAGRRSGWVFADGLLTAQELTLLERPPLIVVANACHPARLGSAGGPRTGTGPGSAAADRTPWGHPQAALAPSLADEFLRIRVGHHVGAAWRIRDEQAVTFAEQARSLRWAAAAPTVRTAAVRNAAEAAGDGPAADG
ncbi:hypothetical protein [Streptomyces manipurensis]|uniref:hypothetical protein n=1 Tax=Streptomyces manipurensis TaxID=1077945 RepID=UPI003C6EFA25